MTDRNPSAEADPLAGSAGMETVEALLRHRLAELLGGWRGAAETAVPTLAFVVGWSASQNVTLAVIASLVAVVPLVLIRLAQRQTARFALSSLVPTLIAAVFALRTGQAEAAFLPGILWNAGMGIGALVSVLVNWPLAGFVVAAADPDARVDPAVFTKWRADPGMVAVSRRLTLVLAVLFLVRVTVMFPMYLAAQVELLGLAKIALGWPAYLLAIAVMAGMLWRGHTPLRAPEDGVSPRR